MQQSHYLETLQQYQSILRLELKQLEQTAADSALSQAFNNVQETISMIFSKLAEGSQNSTCRHSICPQSTTSYPHNYFETCPALSQQLYSQIRTKSQELERADRKFMKRLQKIQILLYQKDYEEALSKIDSYKKNNVTFETENSEEGLKSLNDSINQAFYHTQHSQIKHTDTYNKLKAIIDDDTVSLTIKEQLVFDLYCVQESDEQPEERNHVTLKEVLKLKSQWDKGNKSRGGLQAIIDTQNQNIQNQIHNNPFQQRIQIKNLKNLLEESPILPKEKLKSEKMQEVEKILVQPYQQTGKKKPIMNITDLSCLNLISEVYNSDTGRKLMTKRQRSMTSRKRQSGEQKKSKTLHKETEKKKTGKRQVAYSKAFR